MIRKKSLYRSSAKKGCCHKAYGQITNRILECWKANKFDIFEIQPYSDKTDRKTPTLNLEVQFSNRTQIKCLLLFSTHFLIFEGKSNSDKINIKPPLLNIEAKFSSGAKIRFLFWSTIIQSYNFNDIEKDNKKAFRVSEDNIFLDFRDTTKFR